MEGRSRRPCVLAVLRELRRAVVLDVTLLQYGIHVFTMNKYYIYMRLKSSYSDTVL